MLFDNSVIVSKLRRHLLIPFYWEYINQSKVLGYYQKLKDYQWNSLKENQKIQHKKLYKLIEYASQNIPYYQRVIKEDSIIFSEDTIFEDIKKFPILTKEIIRGRFHELYKFKDHTYYQNTSGGSTGEPVAFYQDKEYFSWANATKRLFDEWAGRELGDPMVKLWSSLPDNLGCGQLFKEYLRQQVSGITILGSSRMTEEEMYKHVQKINKIKPRLILAYTNSMEELTRFIQEQRYFKLRYSTVTAPGKSVIWPVIAKKMKDYT